MVSDDKVHDPEIYPSPNSFSVERFLNLRNQPGNENKHQFVTTTPAHIGFGHGQHACPGRFFASNEIKIALCFLLLRYDMRFVPGKEVRKDLVFENVSSTHPDLQVQMRRRKEEIDLMDLGAQA